MNDKTKDFIKKALEKHVDNNYDYSKVEYISAKSKVLIHCIKHNIDFIITPTNHLSGQKCILCAKESRTKLRTYTKQKFIEEAIKKHGDKYDYSQVEYINSQTDIIIICKEHGSFLQKPVKHLQGHNCITCSNISRVFNKYDDNESFINKAIKVHGVFYDYSKTKYTDSLTDITIICKLHGEFNQRPANHLQGGMCPICANISRSVKQRLTQEEFISKAINMYGDSYDYSKIIYINIDTKCIFRCVKHNFEFEQTPYNHLNYIGCKKCSKQKHSQKAINWLNFLSKIYNIDIQHAENKGEFRIPNTNYEADGYCKNNNTIYEFHGTIYHGDPRFCKSNEFNYLGKNYGELYQKTLERELIIKKLGYNLIIIWEYDWNKINKLIKILQKKFRKYKKQLN